MPVQLTPLEARVIGALIEKQITTPDQYPLSLNALTSACNQKTNRDPVLNLDDRTVQQTVDALIRKHWVLEKSGFGSRVPKYQHVFLNTEFAERKFSPQEVAVLCELLLRGPQTPGELRARAARMCEINDVADIDAALQSLTDREDGPFVARLAREPGRREARFAQLFTGDVPAQESQAAEVAIASGDDERIAQLEQQVAALRRELQELKRQLGVT